MRRSCDLRTSLDPVREESPGDAKSHRRGGKRGHRSGSRRRPDGGAALPPTQRRAQLPPPHPNCARCAVFSSKEQQAQIRISPELGQQMAKLELMMAEAMQLVDSYDPPTQLQAPSCPATVAPSCSRSGAVTPPRGAVLAARAACQRLSTALERTEAVRLSTHVANAFSTPSQKQPPALPTQPPGSAQQAPNPNRGCLTSRDWHPSPARAPLPTPSALGPAFISSPGFATARGPRGPMVGLQRPSPPRPRAPTDEAAAAASAAAAAALVGTTSAARAAVAGRAAKTAASMFAAALAAAQPPALPPPPVVHSLSLGGIGPGAPRCGAATAVTASSSAAAPAPPAPAPTAAAAPLPMAPPAVPRLALAPPAVPALALSKLALPPSTLAAVVAAPLGSPLSPSRSVQTGSALVHLPLPLHSSGALTARGGSNLSRAAPSPRPTSGAATGITPPRVPDTGAPPSARRRLEGSVAAAAGKDFGDEPLMAMAAMTAAVGGGAGAGVGGGLTARGAGPVVPMLRLGGSGLGNMTAR
ncbi:hypothetical protein HYH03_010013 [Edaphochlamys debaryana]|uniref:Uncharacterized protein n=1 Tax=Edaphochlamys debaryana TaxID=47281 RepID=A0A835XWR8_9CHLO|nr:hypothetical protein HYH03_010013 [Edaphochlamys debaryana]|eukprot:KAG2491643.1 hypothetical protein HYH03_010013 [Edaphochlamys debaryana]